MKILLNKYPKGTYKGQMSDGKFMDGYLYENLKILAKRIVDDMTFMGVIFSSTLEVGTGKSVLATQIGEAWTEIMKDMHNIDVPFTINNIVWKPKDLIERAFQVPKYSFILLDEWEDQTYWSQLGMTLRQFFRKCRQLNLFMMVIIPNWFQLNLSYAVSRSVFAIDVKFEKDFQRGYFSFYSFQAKRNLYIKGRKEHNYHVVRPTFNGQFIDGYGIDETEYRKKKMQDMMEYDKENDKPKPLDVRLVTIKAFQELRKKIPKMPMKVLAEAFGVSEKSGFNWLKVDIAKEIDVWNESGDNYINNPIVTKEIIWDEEKVKEQEAPQEEVEE